MLILLLHLEFTEYGKKSPFDLIYVGDPGLNLTRVICCFLLHATLLPEIQSAKKMLSFAKKNPNAFKGQRFEFPMLFGLFKLTTAFLCFVVNVAIMAKSETIEDVVKDFVAAQIIATIDELMLTVVPSEYRIDDMQLLISIDRMKRDDIDIARKFFSCCGKRSTEKRYRDDLKNGEFIRPLTCC